MPVENALIELETFLGLNKHASATVDAEGEIRVTNPWGKEDAELRLKDGDIEFFADLNSVVLNPKFDAIVHCDTNCIEFLYTFLRADDESAAEYKDRKFTVLFGGIEYTCWFGVPTERLMRFARHYHRAPSSDAGDASVPQLRMFRDYAFREDKNPNIRRFFDERYPRNFFIECDRGFGNTNFESLARHVNFLLRYYDRQSPHIVIKETPGLDDALYKKPLRQIEGGFPVALALPDSIDDIILRLIEVAKSSSPRFAFIYYYQVFEYTGYHYMDEKARLAFRNALRDPALLCGDEDKLSGLFTIFADLAHQDDVKMRKVIEAYCDPRVLWKEIANDLEFFSQPQQFDGGFVAQPLISKDVTEATWVTMWCPKTFDLLTKIRNVLVHAREKRESNVILPSQRNNQTLFRYIPLISRMAEQLALKAS